jgi:putative hydrolase of HD superfamily
MPTDRLASQIEFLVEADKLKGILRRTPLVDGSRLENSAEHSWHLVLFAMVLREHLQGECDLLHTLELLAVHDIVEIDAGDTFAYDAGGHETKEAREREAADRLFGMLPADQGGRFRALWEEFEARESVDARFANALDRLQPLLQNARAGGGSWRDHDLSRAQVMKRMSPIEHTMPEVWPMVVATVDAFVKSGLLKNR